MPIYQKRRESSNYDVRYMPRDIEHVTTLVLQRAEKCSLNLELCNMSAILFAALPVRSSI